MKQPKGAEKEKNPQGADQQSGVSKEYKNYDIGLKSLPPPETPSVEKIVEEVEKDKEISELKAEIKKLIANLKKMEKEFDSK